HARRFGRIEQRINPNCAGKPIDRSLARRPRTISFDVHVAGFYAGDRAGRYGDSPDSIRIGLSVNLPRMSRPTSTLNLARPPAPLREDLLSQWMLRPDVAFLNHGSFGAVPWAVFEEQERWRRRLEAEPIELLGRR